MHLFQSIGYEVLTAANGKAALDVLQRSEKVDVLFTDVAMPGGMNGIKLAHEALNMRPGLKIILASGYSLSALADDTRGLDKFAFVSKPYRWTEVSNKLKAMA